MNRKAFTLVELLVVIGIIALLVGILLPVLGRVRNQANSTACKSNLAQVGIALRLYADDNDDKYPDKFTLGGEMRTLSSGSVVYSGWGYRVRPGYKSPLNDPAAIPEYFGLPALLHGITGLQDLDSNGRIIIKAKYIPGDSNLWICPAQREDMTVNGNTYTVSIVNSILDYKSLQRSRARGDDFVWDNFSQRPAPSGFRFGSNTSGYTYNTSRERPLPHGWSPRSQVGRINVLNLGGHVDERIWHPAGGFTDQ